MSDEIVPWHDTKKWVKGKYYPMPLTEEAKFEGKKVETRTEALRALAVHLHAVSQTRQLQHHPVCVRRTRAAAHHQHSDVD